MRDPQIMSDPFDLIYFIFKCKMILLSSAIGALVHNALNGCTLSYISIECTHLKCPKGISICHHKTKQLYCDQYWVPS